MFCFEICLSSNVPVVYGMVDHVLVDHVLAVHILVDHVLVGHVLIEQFW